MLSLQNYVNQKRHTIRKLTADPRLHILTRGAVHFLSGFCLSAASLSHRAMPLALGLICSLTGWTAALCAAGSVLGYWLFWGAAGQQGIAWAFLALAAVLLLGDRSMTRQVPALLPAIGGLIVAVCGVLFQRNPTESATVGIYFLRVGLGAGATLLFYRFLAGRNPIVEWLTWGVATLSLAQIAPVSWLGLGFVLAGFLLVSGSFPGAALAGLALDLAGVTPVPMTGVMTLGYLPRFFPTKPRAGIGFLPGCVYLLVMVLCEHWDLTPLVGLTLGGFLGHWFPLRPQVSHRRGETGAAQVRLEMASGILSSLQQVLLEFHSAPIDEDALVSRAAERACNGCSNRRTCKDARRLGQLPGLLLHKPLLASEELPIVCRKSGRFLAELHRSQEQLRSIRADRERQAEYRAALIQQFQFLSLWLQGLSDQLTRRTETKAQYQPKVQVFGNRPEPDNGDRCLKFNGTGCRYYVILCDGMGTGLGAVREGRSAGEILQKLLSVGYPAEHALRTLNSLCALRERAGAVTVDLCEIRLDTGRATLYKWGAVASYLISGSGVRQVGVPSPPPGISVTEQQENCQQVSLRKGEILILCSDGAANEDTLQICRDFGTEPVPILGQRLLEQSRLTGQDDATAVIISLKG